MMVLQYILWNGSPEIFSIGPFTLRWYGLLFAGGFLISQQILYYMYRKEGKPMADVDTLTMYMVIATILGARLGHVFFYQPEILTNDPLGVFLPVTYDPDATFKFRITGLSGLASHGGALAILFALWLYARKKKPGQNYLQVLDRIVILVALTGALIRFGNYFNSEIIGKPTDAPWGVVFGNPVQQRMLELDNPKSMVKDVVIERDDEEKDSVGRAPIKVFVFYKPGITRDAAIFHLNDNAKEALFYSKDFIDDPPESAVRANLLYDEKTNQVVARIKTYGIIRHPAQMYESISCFLLFLFLFGIWWKYKKDLPEGRIFGYFMVILWSLRFAYEFLKENQVDFENRLPLNMGQILSIPLIIVGIFVLIRSYRLKPNGQTESAPVQS